MRTYPSTTHASPARLKCRLVWMWGRATFTTVMSSTMMNWMRAMTARAAHRLLWFWSVVMPRTVKRNADSFCPDIGIFCGHG